MYEYIRKIEWEFLWLCVGGGGGGGEQPVVTTLLFFFPETINNKTITVWWLPG